MPVSIIRRSTCFLDPLHQHKRSIGFDPAATDAPHVPPFFCKHEDRSHAFGASGEEVQGLGEAFAAGCAWKQDGDEKCQPRCRATWAIFDPFIEPLDWHIDAVIGWYPAD